MKIAVAIKQVPSRDSLLKVNSSGSWVEDEDLSYEINEPDAYALEQGLQLKEAQGGEVVVVCAGPDRASSTIREALAKGADRAIHIETEEGADIDPLQLAKMLAAALAGESPDLVLTGLQSDDYGYGQTGVILAEVLGMPHATIIMSVEVQGGAIKVKRELEDGWFQHVEMPLPALLTIQSGATTLRYATLMGIKKAKSKEIRQVTPDGVAASSVKTERIYLPEKSKNSQLFEGDAKQAAEQLIEKLRFEARVI